MIASRLRHALLALLLAPRLAQAQPFPSPHFGAGTVLDGPTINAGEGANLSVTANGALVKDTLGALANQAGLMPDHFKLAADGADDAPSLNRAIMAACAGSIRTILMGSRHYAINSQVVIPCLIMLRGQGFYEQCGSVYTCAGSWLDIGASFIGASSTHGPILITNAAAAGSILENFGLVEPGMTPPPVLVTNGLGQAIGFSPATWAPAPYWFAIELQGAPGVTLRHLMLLGLNAGVFASGSGRLKVEDIRGQVFGQMINIQESYDVTRLTDIHMWPYWSAADPVMLAQQQTAVVVASFRNDTPFMDNIFAFQVRAGIEIGANADGTTTGAQIGKLSCDSALACLLFDPQTVAQPFIAVNNLRTFDNVWSTIYGHTPIVHNAGSTMVKLDGAAIVQIHQAENFGTDVSSFDFPSGTQPSLVHVGTLIVHENQMSPNSYLARFSTAPGALGSAVMLALPPILTGTVSGWQTTNTAPSTGGGTGTLSWNTPVVVH